MKLGDIAAMAALLVFVGLLAGCGYHVPGSGDASVGLQGRTLHVDLFTNRTIEPYLDSIVTDEVTNQLSRSRIMELVEDRSAADLLLDGKVTEFDSEVAAYDADDNISEYRAWMSVTARLLRRDSGEVLWQASFRRSQIYSALSDKSLEQSAQSAAARIIAKRISEDLMARLLVAF